ncbi:hypothetical protein NZD89_12715 [Alicyclobacillus fastidiosus]|uniref:Uncharacterized protein n=1 Tax=Alicyclobacillus fastidiosus TaxID=392011 RepID=A0ABY6ZMJ1_9BACL|nr:hypothetical protein [Alicyclobacillus fastidiosus]WAH44160.1 hypothetical protein NZD89_12715 [Alicyclobacillus fastidiosus]GMA60467.1 hypothetical protein GCM10025859_09070 [Alicyclobacillus fastidiosus]
MLNYIQRWHRKTVRKIAATFGLPEDLSHHDRAHVPQRHVKKPHAFHHRHNQRVADWHAQHAAEVMEGTTRLRRWERFVYKQISRVAR